MVINIISLNVRGLNDRIKRRAIFNHYRSRCDLLCIQETHSVKKNAEQWINEWGGQILFSHGESNSRGTAILVNRSFNAKVTQINVPPEGRACGARVMYQDQVLNIINVYAPNSDSPGFFSELFKQVQNIGSDNVIMIGDYNTVMDISLDRKNSKYNNHQSTNIIKQHMEEMYFTDVWRIRNPEKRRYSWYRHSKFQKGICASRIDFALISEGLADMIHDTFYMTGVESDHSAFFLGVDPCPSERGPGYWKLNVSLLSNAEYLSAINSLLDEKELCYEGITACDKWELLKKDIKLATVTFSKNLASERNIIISNLTESVQHLEDNLETLSDEDLKILENSKIDLNEQLQIKTRGLIFRSKATWTMEAERNTKYFFNLERARSSAKVCNTIIKDDMLIKEPTAILKAQKDFYEELYTSDKSVNFELSSVSMPHIPEPCVAVNGEQFSMNEVWLATKSLKNSKTPGCDGIPVDFYKVFWRKIKVPFYNMMLEVFEQKMLHSSARSGVLNLIPKPNKDTRYLKNLRPITLLNSDYKIIEKCVANRMLTAMDYIINCDQRGFLPNRRIATGIRKVYDAIMYAHNEDKPGIIVNIDFSKAFDKLEMTAIEQSMRFFGFADLLIEWIKTLYHNFALNVQNNGMFSENIKVTRSVHQGAPASSLIFIVVAETLAIELRKNEKIKGFAVRDIIDFLNQYADDASMCIEDSEEALEEVLHTLDRFQRHSGLEISYEKTTMHRLGSLKDADAKYYTTRKLNWCGDAINVLGVHLNSDLKEAFKINYEPLIVKADSILKGWTKRTLSLVGKIQVINSLVASLFVYKMSVLPAIPDIYIQKLNKMMENFIWNGSRPKIPLRVLQSSIENGGLGLVNFEMKDQSLKTSWVKSVHSDPSCGNLAYVFLNEELDDLIWECNLNVNDVKSADGIGKSNSFWLDALKAWSQVNFEPDVEKQIDPIIWLNSHIRIENKPFFWKKAFRNGLLRVSQLYSDGCQICAQDAKDIFGLSQMHFNSLISAIPKQLRVECQKRSERNENGNDSAFVHDFRRCKKPTKLSYKLRMEKHASNFDDLVVKWEEDLQICFCVDEFKQLCVNIRKATCVGKLRSFQYRVLHRALVTNIHLKHWKMRESDMCSFCELHRESAVHLLVQCDKVQIVWRIAYDFIRTHGFEIDSVSQASKILGDKGLPQVVNMVFIAVKQYIYCKRCKKEPLNIREFRSILYDYFNIEKFYATKDLSLHKFNKKWNIIDTVIDSFNGDSINQTSL